MIFVSDVTNDDLCGSYSKIISNKKHVKEPQIATGDHCVVTILYEDLRECFNNTNY